jgi:hypothetical protein
VVKPPFSFQRHFSDNPSFRISGDRGIIQAGVNNSYRMSSSEGGLGKWARP